MTNGITTLTISEWFMIRGIFWEYYVTEAWNKEKRAYCLVDGDVQEIGLVSLHEIKPYIISRTKDLENLLPAPGWTWID